MPYRFYKKETVTEGFRRIINEQTAGIVGSLADDAGDPVSRIHDARRRLKRLRSLIQLFSDNLDAETVSRELAVYRNISTRLGTVRDANVALHTLEKISMDLIGPLEPVRALLAAADRKQHKRMLSADRLATFATRIRTSSRNLDRQKLTLDGWDSFGPAIHQTYQSARKARRVKKNDHEAIHTWRKLTKDLHYQLTVLGKAVPGSMASLFRKSRRLTEILGRYQDLHVLRSILAEHAAHGVSAASFPALEECISLHMRRILKRANRVAKEVFKLRPKDFSSRLRSGWKRWHSSA